MKKTFAIVFSLSVCLMHTAGLALPGYGLTADIRDITANGGNFWNEPSWGSALGTVGAFAGLVPVAGDFAKGAIKVGREAAQQTGQAALKGTAKAPEKMATDMAKRIEKDLGILAREEFHDVKQFGIDRTVQELKDDAMDLYRKAGKTPPKWMQ